MAPEELQKQMMEHIAYVFSELNQIIALLNDDKERAAIIRLAILAHNVGQSNKALDAFRAPPEAPKEPEAPAPQVE